MKIIGHRGAAGLALENTIASIKKARVCGVDMIEMDVRITKDNQLVLCHDETTGRSFDVNLAIAEHTLKELQLLCPELPTLRQALKACGDTPVIIEIKARFEPELLFAVLEEFPKLQIRIASFIHPVLSAVKKYKPGTFTYALEHHSPFDIINRAKSVKADGIGLNYSLLNPLTYWLAKHRKLEIYIYTLNSPFVAWLIAKFYPRVAICSDRPDTIKKRLAG